MTIFDRLEAQLLDAHPHRSRRAVLNATTKPGLARDAAYALQRHGWKIGTVSNYTDRTLDASAVDFVPGRSAAASLIAKELGIYNVVPATRLVTALAGPKAGVIVIVGRNRAGGWAVAVAWRAEPGDQRARPRGAAPGLPSLRSRMGRA